MAKPKATGIAELVKSLEDGDKRQAATVRNTWQVYIDNRLHLTTDDYEKAEAAYNRMRKESKTGCVLARKASVQRNYAGPR